MLIAARNTYLSVRHTRTGTFRLGWGRWGRWSSCAKKNYVMPECVSVEIGMQTHSNCMKKSWQFLHLIKLLYFVMIVIFLAYSMTSVNRLYCHRRAQYSAQRHLCFKMDSFVSVSVTGLYSRQASWYTRDVQRPTWRIARRRSLVLVTADLQRALLPFYQEFFLATTTIYWYSHIKIVLPKITTISINLRIREFDWLYYCFLSADKKQLRISAHRASHLNLMQHNKTVLFYALPDIFSFYAMRLR